MRKNLLHFFNFSFLILTSLYSTAQAPDLKYYLPDSVSYNPSIPKPKDIIYHQVGEWHVTHDRLVNYMKAIAAAAPERVKLEIMGFTYENRPQVLLIITSPKNHQRLEEIRQQHVLLSDPAKSSSVNIENMPIVVWIGHSIHGNEPSGANAALLSAYYLAAAQGKEIEDMLDNVVILFDPSFNPDGLQRFSKKSFSSRAFWRRKVAISLEIGDRFAPGAGGQGANNLGRGILDDGLRVPVEEQGQIDVRMIAGGQRDRLTKVEIARLGPVDA